MSDNNSEILFQHLRNILFMSDCKELDLELLSDDFKDLGQGMNLLGKWLKESRTFAKSIADGDLVAADVSSDNPICDSLKQLRSNLIHLTWQSTQVARGDYSQKVAFLGEFSVAFNQMTEQLKHRELCLKEEAVKAEEFSRIMEESVELLTSITDSITDNIFVFGKDTNENLFRNKAAIDLSLNNPELYGLVSTHLIECKQKNKNRYWEEEFTTNYPSAKKFNLKMQSFSIEWHGQSSNIYLVQDITERLKTELQFKELAYSDALTGFYNRHYLISILEKYIAEKIDFVVCFIDLDNLKYVNDTFGHPDGDDYIKTVSRILGTSFQYNSSICRFGGDEFVIILRNSILEFAEARMAQVNLSLKKISESQKLYPMAISYGAIFVDGTQNLTPQELLDLADQKMYIMKKQNRVKL